MIRKLKKDEVYYFANAGFDFIKNYNDSNKDVWVDEI